MERKHLQLFFVLFLILSLLFAVQSFALNKDEIKQIQQAIQAKGANWTATENWVTKLSPEQKEMLIGEILEDPDPELAQEKYISLPTQDDLPAHFDWRNNNGNWVTPVTNQLNCGSCWAFAAVAQVESWWKIHFDRPDTNIDLSEQFVLSCSDGTCSGWSTAWALEFIRQTGIPSEACMPYEADDTIPCGDACPDWQSQAVSFPGWGYVTMEEPIVENIKRAVYLHPLSVSFTVYSDFMSYGGGVYEHVWGESEGGHGVLIVGWDDEGEYWIVKNSWGPQWGENGYFRIKWGDSEMGSYSPFIWDEIGSPASLDIPNNNFSLSLTRGDSIVQDVTIKNNGDNNLIYTSFDYKVELQFHSDNFSAYDGVSWWCGNKAIGGYSDHWLDYLYTPELDLSTTSAPKLTCMVKWAMEDPAGASDTDPNYDGWDGCNVWVSTDGGKTFDVLMPSTPQYNTQSLWSFGHPEQGWNYGHGIAGWAGLSNGWKQAEFDLSAYKSDQTIIRFALASDMAYSRPDDPSLLGFFVDNIQVADGANIIFENNGEDNGDMRRDGFSLQEAADWLDVTNRSGTISANDSTEIGISINTRELDAGAYSAKIYVSSSDTTVGMLPIGVSFNLQKPAHDLAIKKVWLPGENIPILFPIDLGAEIANEGLNNEANFNVVCRALNQGTEIYSDTAFVETLLAGEIKVINFKPLLMTETGELDFQISLENIVDDYNTYNNQYQSLTTVSNLVDGFETETGLWTFTGGWGITNVLMGHTGEFAAHVNGGNLPYRENMDAYMTFAPGFDVTSIDAATLKYWTKYVTEPDSDVCYIEASGDKVNWTTLDSLTGNNFRAWTQREVGLTQFIDSGYEKIWVRFHFVSNGSVSMAGVLIDDVEIYPTNPTDVQTDESAERVPTEWNLSQNYPNPFNLNTSFRYTMPEPAEVHITIYNINGKVVRNLLNQYQSAGRHEIGWDGRNDKGQTVGSGVFLYQVNVKGKFHETRKMILLK